MGKDLDKRADRFLMSSCIDLKAPSRVDNWLVSLEEGGGSVGVRVS